MFTLTGQAADETRNEAIDGPRTTNHRGEGACDAAGTGTVAGDACFGGPSSGPSINQTYI